MEYRSKIKVLKTISLKNKIKPIISFTQSDTFLPKSNCKITPKYINSDYILTYEMDIVSGSGKRVNRNSLIPFMIDKTQNIDDYLIDRISKQYDTAKDLTEEQQKAILQDCQKCIDNKWYIKV